MSQYTFKMPDLGEGTVDAEIVAWHTKPGDVVTEDQLIVEVMTDKAAVEVPAPVSGRVLSVTGVPGDKVAVGSPLIVFELSDGAVAAPSVTAAPAAQAKEKAAMPQPAVDDRAAAPQVTPTVHQGRVMTSPANRRRAREAGIDLATITGSRPGGRIVRGISKKVPGAGIAPASRRRVRVTEIKVIGGAG